VCQRGEDAGESLMMGDFKYLAFETLSVHKVREFGFFGFVATLESIFESIEEDARFGTLPPKKVDAARPSAGLGYILEWRGLEIRNGQL
jgi:hypothetical protein